MPDDGLITIPTASLVRATIERPIAAAQAIDAGIAAISKAAAETGA
jgi:hypothetical protein